MWEMREEKNVRDEGGERNEPGRKEVVNKQDFLCYCPMILMSPFTPIPDTSLPNAL